MPARRSSLLVLGSAILASGGVALLVLREPPVEATPVAISATAASSETARSGRPAPREPVALEAGADVVIRTPEELRAFKRRCNGAGTFDEPWLRQLALHAEDPLVAGQAIQALGRLGLFGNDPAHVRLLEDPRARVRHEAVRALGGSRDESVAAILAPLLAEEDDTARVLAIQALGKLPGREAREALLNYEQSGTAEEVDLAFLRAALSPQPIRIGQRAGAAGDRSPVNR